jgi:cytochrome-b5 reductase
MIEKYMPEGGASVKDSKVLLCGPPPMIEAMKRVLDSDTIPREELTTKRFHRRNLGSLGYPAPRALSKLEDQVFCF